MWTCESLDEGGRRGRMFVSRWLRWSVEVGEAGAGAGAGTLLGA